jgi:hypothetical protein
MDVIVPGVGRTIKFRTPLDQDRRIRIACKCHQRIYFDADANGGWKKPRPHIPASTGSDGIPFGEMNRYDAENAAAKR